MAAGRTFLKISALLLLVAVGALAVFIATFDLNRYRAVVEKGIAGALDRPVTIGEAKLSVRHGLAIDLRDLHIGPKRRPGSDLEAAHLFLKLDLPALLGGRIDIEEVILSEPQLRLSLSDPQAEKGTPLSPRALDRMQQARLGTLRIVDGRVRVEDRRRPQSPLDVTFKGIDGLITGLAAGERSRIRLDGELEKDGSTFAIQGEMDLPADPRHWREIELHLETNLRNVTPATLLDSLGVSTDALAGRGDLGLRLEGTPARGLKFEANLRGEDLSLNLPDLYSRPVPLPPLTLAGLWSSSGDTERVSDLRLAGGGMTLEGALRLEERDGERFIAGELSSPPVAHDHLTPFVPDRPNPQLVELLRERLVGGTFRLEELSFAGRLDGGVTVQRARGEIRDGRFMLPRKNELEQFETTLVWDNGVLEVQDGSFRLAGERLHLSGAVKGLPQGEAELSLEAYGTLPAERLLAMLPDSEKVELTVGGPLPLSVTVMGPPGHLLVDMKVDLKHLAFNLESKLRKPAGLEARLFATAEITPERLELNHGLLDIPPMELRARGSVQRREGHPFVLDLNLAPLDMQQARFRTPVLDRFEPRGRIAADYRLSGSRGRLEDYGGRLLLRGFGMRIPGPVADLLGADGEIALGKGTARIERLTARLGSSPVQASGEVTFGDDFRLDLDVRSPAMRASDLIFPNPEKVLHDLEGHLLITRGGISFAPVSVRIAEATSATVRGTLENFKSPDVRLEIESERADIMEIIGLWKRPPGVEPKPPGKKKLKVGVRIEARVDDGVLGPLRFSNGRATITTKGKQLIIHPLQFEAGDGRCTGQVLVDRTSSPPPLLRISGHLQNIGAETLQHDLLKKRGLVTGSLNGDFYLEGRVGPTFLPTSLGGFSLQVKDGVLRKFRVLSRVFSLLNVSQLFEFNLPEVDEAGMPFERLTGSFGLRQGVLATEDLFVKSNAMNLSLVGQADLVKKDLDFVLGVKPLRTVDKIVTQIPIAGWLLTGDEKALLTAHFLIGGEPDDPEVMAIPISSVSDKAIGIFKRVFGLPGKLITDPEEIFKGSD